MYCVIMRKQCLAVFVALTVILNNQWQVVFAEDQGVNPDKNDPEYPVNFEESLDSNEECSAGEGAHRILNRQTRQAIKEDDPNCLKRWPNGHIPWRFERTTNAIQPEQEQGIRDAIAEWERLTCLTLEDINDDDTKWNQEHFLIQNQHSLGCYAIIGRYCGKHGQIVNIASVCTSQGLIMHELAHGFGVYHQHTRPDRDDYVIIVDENVPDARKIDFQMVDSEMFDIPYDYGSLMHYSKTTAGSETNPTILTKDPQRQFTIGNNEKPTHYDIALINRMYNCSGHCENPPTCENGGYVDKHCNCSCPHNTEGSRCETVTGEYYTNVLDSCGDQLVEDTTVIKTFNFPNVKPVGPKFYKCMWYLKSPAGKKAQVTFTNFNLYAAINDKCVFDKLDMMYDLYTSGERVCGNTFQGQTISATQGSLVMVWTASTMGFATGFQATVTFVDDIQPTTAPPTPPPTVPPTPKPPQPTTKPKPCVIKIRLSKNKNEMIKSKGYPKGKGPQECEWVIQNPEKSKKKKSCISIQFQDLTIPNNKKCKKGYVQIHKKGNKKYGKKKCKKFKTKGKSKMSVRFRTTLKGNYKGFKATIKRAKC